MDQVDRDILRLLQEDGRLSNVELADRVRLTPSPCLRRVRNLEESGVITGYRAVIDPAAVGRAFQVFVYIDLALPDRKTIIAFEEGVMKLVDVIECHRMFGQPDYMLRIAMADMAAYERFVQDELASLPGVGRLTSQIAMKAVKPGGPLPV
jgi:DNA-binding Lrp family transcriptional regulator